jgi:hypothetical protein
MKIVFNKIPKLAQFFYLAGFMVILTALINYFVDAPFISTLLMQQLFIAGAIIVAIGSVINTLFQFSKKK